MSFYLRGFPAPGSLLGEICGSLFLAGFLTGVGFATGVWQSPYEPLIFLFFYKAPISVCKNVASLEHRFPGIPHQNSFSYMPLFPVLKLFVRKQLFSATYSTFRFSYDRICVVSFFSEPIFLHYSPSCLNLLPRVFDRKERQSNRLPSLNHR